MRDLRISVTDRCNFRCTYCMPKEVFGPDYQFLDREAILTYEEVARLARIFASLGVTKIRITGGEPLVRRDLDRLVVLLREIPAISDLTLTTNGSLLRSQAQRLADAGLGRITVSLDSLDDETFGKMNDAGARVASVLDGIAAAHEAGLQPVKVNVVVQRGVNEHAVLELAEHFRGTGDIVRFIEYMDVGNTNGWRMEHVVTAAQMIESINGQHPIEPIEPNYQGEVARRWRYRDGAGELGFITSISEPFCGDCSRTRLSAEGEMYTCLFGSTGLDLRTPLRSGATDEEILDLISGTWRGRDDRYSEIRSSHTTDLPRVEMSRIGG